MPPLASTPIRGDFAFLSRGFRPFFLLAALHAIVWIPLWLAMLRGRLPMATGMDPIRWHGHEMLFGFTAAAIAGFLLTAVPAWSGTAPIRGRRLAVLAALWVAGRCAFLAAGPLPAWVVALADLPFLPALAAALGTALLARGPRRDTIFLVALVGLVLANGLFHLHGLGLPLVEPRALLRAAVGVVAVLLVLIGGRLTPASTRSALARTGVPVSIPPSPRLDRIATVAAGTAAVAALAPAPGILYGSAAAVAGAAVLGRLAGWQTRRTLHDPLLWSLHAGQAWLGAGLLAAGIAVFWPSLPATAALHALTAGAMGSTILTVMTRVSLGQTGRPFVALPGTSVACAGVHLGAAVRVAGPLLAPSEAPTVWLVAGALWAAPFAFFLVRYGPLLLRPRPDEMPGGSGVSPR